MKLDSIIKNVKKDSRIKEIFITDRQVRVVVNVFCEKIIEALEKDGIAKIYGLFTLKFKINKGRNIVNPQTREKIKTSDFTRLQVKPSKSLKEVMKKHNK